MPLAYSVENITTIISGIIANADQLQNITVRGVVSLEKGQDRFTLLNDNNNQIICFIPKSVNVSLPQKEKTVIVVGDFSLHPTNSIYQIKVKNILEDNIGINASSIEEITNELTGIISGIPELQNIQVQGEVSALFMSSDVLYWNLQGKNLAFPNVSIIQCANIRTKESIVQIGNEICIKGKITILPQSSKYQIEVSHIYDDATNNGVDCKCPGCDACQTMQGKGKCPPLLNPDYELCQLCYNVSPDREDRVKNTVYAYFDALGGNGFSSQKKRRIRMGTENQEVDVILVDENESIAAIAKCYGSGYIGYGIEQLKSFLSTTDSTLGIFANRVDPRKWKYYKNLRQNQFEMITINQFKGEIKNIINCIPSTSRDQIDTLKSEKEDLEQTVHDLKEQFDRIKEICQNIEQIADKEKEEIDE